MHFKMSLAMAGTLAVALGAGGCKTKTRIATVDTVMPAATMKVPGQDLPVARPGGKLPGNVAIDLVEVAGGFVDPIGVSCPPDGSGRIFVCERPGIVRIIDKNGKVLPEPFYDDMSNTFFQFLECGLYDVEFHPNFKKNGLFYVSYADMWFNGATMIVQYRVSPDNPNKADMKSARPIMRIDFPYANHHGGKIAFGPDGYLYVGVGDGGWEGDVLDAGPNLGTWLGKMLRIKVHEEGYPTYSVPASNPFTEAASPQRMVLFGKSEKFFSKIKQHARPEIWAFGIRNPWTFSFDRKTGDLYIADIGQNIWEEVNFQPASSKGGEHYGWNYMCGVHPFPISLEKEGKPWPVVGELPVAEYKHAEGNNCVIGFGVSRSKAHASLDGVYFFGDWGSGRVWGIKRDGGKWAMQDLMNTGLHFTSGGEDTDGNIYVTTAGSQYGTWNPFESEKGSVWKLVPAGKAPAGAKTAPKR